MKCLKCNEYIKSKYSKKFCNSNCSASYNNISRTKYKNILCFGCNKKFTISEKDKRKKCFDCSLIKNNLPKIIKKECYVECKACNKSFKRINNKIYCSLECKKQSNKKHKKTCQHCKCDYMAEKQDSKFCSHSCRSVCLKLHTNAHIKSGLSRSKIEQFVEINLINDFNNLKIIFNDKNTIGSELDIYFPELKMAFELNGVFHYIPIYGEGTLEKIQNRDKNKYIMCEKLGIELVTINLGNCNFTKKYAKNIYDQIFKIVDKNKKRKMWAESDSNGQG
jgi:hypothetical protein